MMGRSRMKSRGELSWSRGQFKKWEGATLEVGDSGRYPRGGRFWRIRVEHSYEQEGWNDN